MNYKIFGILLVVGLCFSCEKEQRVTLNETEKVIYDSLYRARAVEAKVFADSICISTHDSIFHRMVDSILTIRYREINEILEE